MKIGKYEFKRISSGCPEAYDVFDEKGVQVGYVKLRYGTVYAQAPCHGGMDIYYDHVGDGLTGRFESDKQRRVHLKRIAFRIDQYLFKARCPDCGHIHRLSGHDIDELNEVGKAVLECSKCNRCFIVVDDGDWMFVRSTY